MDEFNKRISVWRGEVSKQGRSDEEKKVLLAFYDLITAPRTSAGACHANSALMAITLRDGGIGCAWNIGYTEIFPKFYDHCLKVSANIERKGKLFWHSWLEIDGGIVDFTISKQASHHGFPPIFMNQCLGEGITYNSEDDSFRDGDGDVLLRYHKKYPKSCPRSNLGDLDLPYPMRMKTVNFLDNYHRRQNGWKEGFERGFLGRKGIRLQKKWEERYNTKAFCNRYYISRYIKETEGEFVLTDLITFLVRQYESSGITDTLILLPAVEAANHLRKTLEEELEGVPEGWNVIVESVIDKDGEKRLKEIFQDGTVMKGGTPHHRNFVVVTMFLTDEILLELEYNFYARVIAAIVWKCSPIIDEWKTQHYPEILD